MDFRNDTNALATSDEYMLGPAFLTCPVTTPQAMTRSVYLPSGTKWVNFWSGEAFAGGNTITADAPINILPLYVRAGSIVPFGPVMQYATENAEDPIELRVYRGADGGFTFYEDQGDNCKYEKGVYATIPFTWNEASQMLTIGKRSGRFPGMLKKLTIHVIFVSPNHGTGIASEEQVDATVIYTGKPITVNDNK
jgi:alpha-D-xyloside xylohydrolase